MEGATSRRPRRAGGSAIPTDRWQRPPVLVFYVSGHGFGHAVRAGLVIRALGRLAPHVRVQVRTDRPSWLFPAEIALVPGQVDAGMVQSDSLTLQVDETLRRAAAFEAHRPALARAQAEAMAAHRPAAIISDIPPLAFDVARLLGVPSVAIGNFAWSWIYANMGSRDPAVAVVCASLAASEAHATLLLRPPLHADLSSFAAIEDIPLIAQTTHADPAATRQRLGIPAGQLAVLLSFGGPEIERIDYRALGRQSDRTFVLTARPAAPLPPNVIVGPRDPAGYIDLLAACDVVVMKPGYGTVADCLANRVPMVYTTRPGFAEEPVLVDAMHRLGRAVPLAQDDLLAGRLGSAIDAARSLATSWGALSTDGAERAARRILAIAGLAASDGDGRAPTGTDGHDP